MSVQVAAHGFELTEGLRTACENEAKDKLQLLALSNFSTKWVLSIEKNEHVAHLAWTDGAFRGDVTVQADDMYKSIAKAGKKASEQIKKAHQKRNGHKGVAPAKTMHAEAVAEETGDHEG